MTRAKELESSIDSAIANRLGTQKHGVWFKNATKLTLADRHLHISTTNHFVSEFIERHFSDVIIDAGREVIGADLTLSFALDPMLAKNVTRRQPDRQADMAAKIVPPGTYTPVAGGSSDPFQLKGRFDDFVVGDSNRLAHAAARTVAENPGDQYSSLFIHGGCGLGKTHLLQAVCNYFRQFAPQLRWKYVTGEDFTNDYLYCLRNGKMDFFNERYRGLDALIIDDVHFLANKKATQDGFLHTFKAIDAGGKQIVLASDAHPKLITSFSESLTSRFLAGMVARVDAPDLPVRVNVLRRKAARIKADVSDAVLQHIAERFDSNVRELEGALLKVVALGQINGKPLTPAMVDQSLRELVRCVSPAVKLNDIENTVSIYFGLRSADLHTSKKSRTIALARGIAMYLARKHTDMSFPEIGRFMGKNHTTVILACRRIGDSMAAGEVVQWISAGGPRSKDINVILQDIEAQTGIALLREASMPTAVVGRRTAAAGGNKEGSMPSPSEDNEASQRAEPSAVLGAA